MVNKVVSVSNHTSVIHEEVSLLLKGEKEASIDVETSMASMISIPSTCLLPHEVYVCGRAKMMTASTKVAHLSSTGKFISRVRQLFGA